MYRDFFGNNIEVFNFSFKEFSSLFYHFQNRLKNKLDLSLLITKSVVSFSWLEFFCGFSDLSKSFIQTLSLIFIINYVIFSLFGLGS
jgi:hypothetical protein